MDYTLCFCIPYFFDQTKWLLLSSLFVFVRLLFEGGYYSRAATIWGWLLFKGGYYSRAATIWGQLLFEGGYYLRAATIQGRLLFEGGLFWWAAFENTMRKRALALLWHDHAYKTYRSNSCNNVSYSFSVPRMVQFSKVAWQHTHTHMRWWASLFFAKRVAWKSLRSC